MSPVELCLDQKWKNNMFNLILSPFNEKAGR